MEKNTDKVQKGNSQTNEKHTVGQSVKHWMKKLLIMKNTLVLEM